MIPHFRQNHYKPLNLAELYHCINNQMKWVNFKFPDGRVVTVRIDNVTMDFLSPKITGYVLRRNLKIIYQGKEIATPQQAPLNNTVQVILPNHTPLTLYLTHFDDYSFGGTINLYDMSGLSAQGIMYQCFSAEPNRCYHPYTPYTSYYYY